MATAPHVPPFRLPQTDRPYRWSVVFSIAIHAIVLSFFLVHEINQRKLDEALRRAPGAPGTRGGGGGAVFRIDLQSYAEEKPLPPVEKPAIPQAVLPPSIKIQRLDVPVQTGTVNSTVDMSQLGQGGTGSGGGKGTAVGPGIGVDSGRGTGGEGGDMFLPKLELTILPPPDRVPSSVKGHSFKIHFWVDAHGKVKRVRVEPEMKDAAYRELFLDAMRQYTFKPARKLDMTPIEGELTITISL